MKKQFPGYYKLEESELSELWRECTFVLDANTLLNLLRYPKESRDLMFSMLESVQDRIWIPHQAALEYHVILEKVIYEQKNQYGTLEKECIVELEKLTSKLKNLLHSNISTDVMVKSLEQSKETIKSELLTQKEQQPNLLHIKEKINKLIGDNVGPEFSQSELDKIYSEGSQRYESKTPPGFMDNQKKYAFYHNGVKYQAAYGDLILWKQVLKFAEKEDIKSIVLISDDRKEDWIFEVNGEKKGIHPYLINEFNKQSGGKAFLSYNSLQFISTATEFLSYKSDVTVSDAIKEIETVYQKEDSDLKKKRISLGQYNNELLETLRSKFLEERQEDIVEVTVPHYYNITFNVNTEKFLPKNEEDYLLEHLNTLFDLRFKDANILEIYYSDGVANILVKFPYSATSLEFLKHTIMVSLKKYSYDDLFEIIEVSEF
ncbi:PIN-like domain-containing protein [Paenibacillus amylolyticus]|uniref:PIN-like domain-containing protein n=1 Tax=Paenibacillus amylolyticus TaxID=1451 RepID=UPI003242C58F